MQLLTLDLETSVNNDEVGDFKANPHCLKNDIVWFGGKYPDSETFTFRIFSFSPPILREHILLSDILIGQNIKFDLLYMSRSGDFGLEEFFYNGGTIWDIQLAEYLLSGQEYQMQSLNEMCIRYGLPVKDDRISQYWAEGVKTEDIPEEEMRPYLRNDVEVTEKIFIAQLKRASEQNQLELIVSQMDALLATYEMEKNGMFIDLVELGQQEELLSKELESSRKKLNLAALKLLTEDNKQFFTSKEWHPESVAQQSVLIYGGKLNGTSYEPCGIYKTGKRKGETKNKKVVKEFTFDSHLYMIPESSSVDDLALNNILRSSSYMGKIEPFIKEILNFRKLSKEMSTYILSYKNKVWRHDGCIHPNYIHTKTDTGRLSCRNPNLQNTSIGEEDE